VGYKQQYGDVLWGILWEVKNIYIYLHINGDVPYEAICGGYIKGNLDRIE
jgi:hypothetical protein